MNKIAVFEITSNSLSLMVGGIFNDLPLIIYTSRNEYSSLIRNGVFVNKQFLESEIKTMFDDANKKISNISKDIYVVLPNDTIGCYYCSNKSLLVRNSEEKTFSRDDLRYIFDNIKETTISPSSNIVNYEIEHVLDDNKQNFSYKDFNYKTTNVLFSYYYYTMATTDYKDIISVFVEAGLSIKRCVISTVALASYFKRINKYPQKYILIQSYVDRTSLALIDNGFTTQCQNLNIAIEEIYNKICEKFAITYIEARALVLKYGIDLRKYNYNVIIFDKNNINNVRTKITQKDLNKILVEFFNHLVQGFSVESKKILQLGNESGDNITYVIIGSILNIAGFKEGYQGSSKQKILFYESNNICALKQEQATQLAIIANSDDYEFLSKVEAKTAPQIKRENITRKE